MAINANRRFNKYGFKFYVQNLANADRKDGYKYCLSMIDEKEHYNLVYDKITWELPKFKTIKDAHRWVWFHSGEGEFIGTSKEWEQ